MKHRILSRLAAAALALVLCAVPMAAAPSVPDPTDEFYVGDFADVLSDAVEEHILERNQALYEHCGGQIAVVTVDFLDGYDIEDYAVTLFNEWEIGSEKYNNGYLILLAIGEENYYSLPGKGLEDVFDGGTIDDLQWNCLESGFAAGDYDSGVLKYFNAVYAVFEDEYGTAAGSSGSGSTTTVGGSVPPEIDGIQVMHNSLSSVIRRVFSTAIVVIIVIAVLCIVFGFGSISRGYRRPRRTIWSTRRMYRPPMRPMPPRQPRPPQPPRSGGFGGFGGFGGGFGGGGSSRGGGASRRSSSSRSSFGGSSRSSFGGSRSSFGGSRGGGGMSRGGGAGRRR